MVAFEQPFELNVVLNGVMPDGSVTHISNNVHQKSRTLHCLDVSVHGKSLPVGFFFLWTGCKIQLLWVEGSRPSLPVCIYEQDASPLPTPNCYVANRFSESLWKKTSDNYKILRIVKKALEG